DRRLRAGLRRAAQHHPAGGHPPVPRRPPPRAGPPQQQAHPGRARRNHRRPAGPGPRPGPGPFLVPSGGPHRLHRRGPRLRRLLPAPALPQRPDRPGRATVRIDVAVIAPIAHLDDLSARGSIDMALTHLVLTRPDYAAHYAARSAAGTRVILDNSAYELEEHTGSGM